MVENMRNANQSETVKIKTHHARIVVDGTADKPYYSIEWFDPIKKEYYLGYSSYYISTVFNWLSECFEIVEANTTNAGCEFCNDTLKRFPYILATSDTGDCGTVFEPVVCPKCGRRLQQPAEEGS